MLTAHALVAGFLTLGQMGWKLMAQHPKACSVTSRGGEDDASNSHQPHMHPKEHLGREVSFSPENPHGKSTRHPRLG